ncbi:pentapeptide repeat-containing protein [Aquella oligotrophica]|uniref:Pentapeptide repeat-containing protein n=1 Tax=Aquella oligotrophica TaxID=2067065 RepID=A0A2I7N8L7_9NEIS|nr:pentapeptide repeat-containing protein [Aquella oligotrophica]AUR52799.1 hypothetical protein CUN60_11010 [Aquella oligotrophica]
MKPNKTLIKLSAISSLLLIGLSACNSGTGIQPRQSNMKAPNTTENHALSSHDTETTMAMLFNKNGPGGSVIGFSLDPELNYNAEGNLVGAYKGYGSTAHMVEKFEPDYSNEYAELTLKYLEPTAFMYYPFSTEDVQNKWRGQYNMNYAVTTKILGRGFDILEMPNVKMISRGTLFVQDKLGYVYECSNMGIAFDNDNYVYIAQSLGEKLLTYGYTSASRKYNDTTVRFRCKNDQGLGNGNFWVTLTTQNVAAFKVTNIEPAGNDYFEHELRFERADLSKAELDNLSFKNSYLNNVSISNKTINNLAFRPGDFINNKLNLKIDNVIFNNFYSDKSSFVGSEISNSTFNKAVIASTGMPSSMVNVNFIDSHLPSSNYNYNKIIDTNYKNCNLQDSQFVGSSLTNVDFTNSSLKNVNFKGAKLTNVNFTGADLSGAVMPDGEVIPEGKVCQQGSIGKCL